MAVKVPQFNVIVPTVPFVPEPMPAPSDLPVLPDAALTSPVVEISMLPEVPALPLPMPAPDIPPFAEVIIALLLIVISPTVAPFPVPIPAP